MITKSLGSLFALLVVTSCLSGGELTRDSPQPGGSMRSGDRHEERWWSGGDGMLQGGDHTDQRRTEMEDGARKQECPSLHVWNGQITLDRVDTCTISTRGFKASFSGMRAPGLWYGLTLLSCTTCTMRVDSKFESCPDCTFCIAGQSIPDCYNYTIPMVVAILLTMSISFILSYGLHRMDKRLGLVKKVVATIQGCKAKSKERRLYRRARRLDKLVSYMGPSRAAMKPTNDSFSSSSGASSRSPSRERTRGRPVPVAGALALAMAALSQPHTATACDSTITLTTAGEVCTPEGCMASFGYMTTLALGSSLCLSSADSLEAKIMLTKLSWLYKYEFQYATGPFEIKSTSINRCLGSDGCWTEGSCLPNSDHPSLPKIENSTEEITGTHCQIVGGTRDNCFYQQQCVWIRWALIPERVDMEKVYHVYKLVSRSWVAQVMFQTGNTTTFHDLTPSEPMIMTPNPVLVVSFPMDQVEPPRNLMTRDGGIKFYAAEAAPLNSPIANVLGDLQKDSSGRFSFPLETIQCRISGAYHQCYAPESYMQRHQPKDLTMLTLTDMEGMKVLENKIRGLVTISFRFPKELKVLEQPASCEFEFGSVVGCTDCGPTFALLSVIPRHVRSAGIMAVESNCSLETNMFPCGSGPFQVRMLTKASDCCHIWVNGSRDHTICPNFIFLGNVTEISLMTSGDIAQYSGVSGFFGLLSHGNTFFSILSPALIMTTLIVCFVAKLVLIVLDNRR